MKKGGGPTREVGNARWQEMASDAPGREGAGSDLAAEKNAVRQ